MDKKPIYERLLGGIAEFSEDFLELKQFEVVPWRVRNLVSKIFWGYHWLAIAVVLVESKLLDNNFYLTGKLALVLILLWGIYFLNFFLLYLPFNGTYSLYRYLADRNIPPTYAILISLVTVAGVVSIFLFVRSIVNY